METRIYKIKTVFMIPLTLSMILGILLLALCIIQNDPSSKIVVLGIMVLFITVFFVESLFRRLVIDDKTITQTKLLRQKTLAFDKITALDALALRKRVFCTLSTEEDFLIFTNAYEGYGDLMQDILPRLPKNVSISSETRDLAENPPIKRGDIISFWVTAAVLGGILVQQASGFFG